MFKIGPLLISIYIGVIKYYLSPKTKAPLHIRANESSVIHFSAFFSNYSNYIYSKFNHYVRDIGSLKIIINISMSANQSRWSQQQCMLKFFFLILAFVRASCVAEENAA